MIYFFCGFVTGVYGGQEYDLPKFKPILSLLYFKIKEYFEKFEKLSKTSSNTKEEINEVFTRRYAVSDGESEGKGEQINLKED